jgi:hypothetical protein
MSILDEIQNINKENLKESSLSRIEKHMREHDTGIISASRYAPNCGQGKPYTREDNAKRTKSLISKVFNDRYNITLMKGAYIENFGSKNEREVGEKVLFVVDIDNSGNLLKSLRKLGEEFDQDSILFIPKPGNESIAYGTNKCFEAFPGYGKTKVYSHRMLGHHIDKFFTRVNGRPFVFLENAVEESKYYHRPEGFFGRWGCDTFAKMHWQKMELTENDF